MKKNKNKKVVNPSREPWTADDLDGRKISSLQLEADSPNVWNFLVWFQKISITFCSRKCKCIYKLALTTWWNSEGHTDTLSSECKCLQRDTMLSCQQRQFVQFWRGRKKKSCFPLWLLFWSWVFQLSSVWVSRLPVEPFTVRVKSDNFGQFTAACGSLWLPWVTSAFEIKNKKKSFWVMKKLLTYSSHT